MAESERKVLQYFRQAPTPPGHFAQIKTILMEFNNIKPLKVIQNFWQGLHPPPFLAFCPNIELHKKVLQKDISKGRKGLP